ncbi:MAG: ribosome maturation factor RimM [Pseudomonadota bacterium]
MAETDTPSPNPSRKREGLNADKPVTLAVIIGAHGVAGEVRLKLFSESVDSLKQHKAYNQGALTLKAIRPNKAGAIARFAEITNRNAAEAARSTELTVPRSALPPLDEGEYYYADLIDLPVVTEQGEAVGHVIAVDNFGAGDVVEIKKPNGKAFMVPIGVCDIRDKSLSLPVDFVG